MKSRYTVTISLLLLLTLVGCSSTAIDTKEPVPLITLEEAKALILDNRVAKVFQPHHGCVSLLLTDGSSKQFNQPHIDWVVSFIDDNGLFNDIEIWME